LASEADGSSLRSGQNVTKAKTGKGLSFLTKRSGDPESMQKINKINIEQRQSVDFPLAGVAGGFPLLYVRKVKWSKNHRFTCYKKSGCFNG